MPDSPRVCRRPAAFSLIELLVVMGIIVIMTALAGPAFNAIKGGSDLTKTTSDISDLLQQARAYAMANNTYVYFALSETTAGDDHMAGGRGRFTIGIVASKDGSRINGDKVFDKDTVTSLIRLQKIDNITFADAPAGTGGNMERETEAAQVSYFNQEPAPIISPGVPMGSSTQALQKAIEFDPQGVARYYSGVLANENKIQGWIEFSLQPSRGSTAVPGEKNVAAIQVDGMTGAVRVYRP